MTHVVLVYFFANQSVVIFLYLKRVSCHVCVDPKEAQDVGWIHCLFMKKIIQEKNNKNKQFHKKYVRKCMDYGTSNVYFYIDIW